MVAFHQCITTSSSSKPVSSCARSGYLDSSLHANINRNILATLRVLTSSSRNGSSGEKHKIQRERDGRGFYHEELSVDASSDALRLRLLIGTILPTQMPR
jgi:hypothetical protein